MKFTIDIPDEDLVATSAACGYQFGPDTIPTDEEATAVIQKYFDSPHDQVRKAKAKEDPEVVAQEAKVKQETQAYINLVSQKSGVPADELAVGDSGTLTIKP